MAKPKTIILWGLENVIGEAVEMCLSSHKGWEVIRILNNQNIECLNDRIEELNPEVTIIHLGNSCQDSDLALKLIHQYPGLKVITVSLEQNRMEVYSKQEINVNGISDLLTVVEG